MISIFLMSLGFRLFGWQLITKPIGMTLMICAGLLHCTEWWHPIGVILALCFFRWWLPTKPLLAMVDGDNYTPAFARGLAIMPYAFVLFAADGLYMHLLLAYIFSAIFPLIYWASGKQKHIDKVALAELITGACVGAI